MMPVEGTGTEIVAGAVIALVVISVIVAIIIWLKSRKTYLDQYK